MTETIQTANWLRQLASCANVGRIQARAAFVRAEAGRGGRFMGAAGSTTRRISAWMPDC